MALADYYAIMGGGTVRCTGVGMAGKVNPAQFPHEISFSGMVKYNSVSYPFPTTTETARLTYNSNSTVSLGTVSTSAMGLGLTANYVRTQGLVTAGNVQSIIGGTFVYQCWGAPTLK